MSQKFIVQMVEYNSCRLERFQCKLAFQIAPFEAIEEFFQLFLWWILLRDSMVWLLQKKREIFNYDVDSFLEFLRRLVPHNHPPYILLVFSRGSQCHQIIRECELLRVRVRLNDLPILISRYRNYRFYIDKAYSLLESFHFPQKFCFLFRFKTNFACGSLSTNEAIIPLCQPSLMINIFLFCHGISHIALHPVGGSQGCRYIFAHAQSRHPSLVVYLQADYRKKPYLEQISGIQVRVCSHRDQSPQLMVLILKGVNRCSLNKNTLWTLKTRGLALLFHGFEVGFHGAKLRLSLWKKLTLVLIPRLLLFRIVRSSIMNDENYLGRFVLILASSLLHEDIRIVRVFLVAEFMVCFSIKYYRLVVLFSDQAQRITSAFNWGFYS